MPWTYYKKTFWTEDLLTLLELPLNKPQYKSGIRKQIMEKLKNYSTWKEKSIFKKNLDNLIKNKIESYNGKYNVTNFIIFNLNSIIYNQRKLYYLLNIFKKEAISKKFYTLEFIDKGENIETLAI